MGKGRKPSLATPPGVKRAGGNWFTDQTKKIGNLKCDWTYMVMSYEDEVHGLEKNKRKARISIILSFVIPLIILVFIGIVGEFLVIGIILGLILSMAVGFLFIFVYRMIRDNTLNKARWRDVWAVWIDVGHVMAMQAIKEFVAQYGEPYLIEKNESYHNTGNHPEHQYTFNNGVKIKAEFSYTNGKPMGWCKIKYKIKDWEQALQLQLAIDEYMYRKNILRRRRDR